MSYYHVRVSTISRPTRDDVRLDLSAEELESIILGPYRRGAPIIIGGRTIEPADLTVLRINMTDEPSSSIRPIVEQRERNSDVLMIGGPSTDWYVAGYGTEVTEEFVTAPPGSEASPVESPSVSEPATTSDVAEALLAERRRRQLIIRTYAEAKAQSFGRRLTIVLAVILVVAVAVGAVWGPAFGFRNTSWFAYFTTVLVVVLAAATIASLVWGWTANATGKRLQGWVSDRLFVRFLKAAGEELVADEMDSSAE
jgi:hypothetical protein